MRPGRGTRLVCWWRAARCRRRRRVGRSGRPGAEPIDLDGFYQRLAGQGYRYGPVFQGLRAAWRVGGDVCAEVSLPGGVDAAGYGIHPALLDAALHGLLLGGGPEPEGVRLPFSWAGVSLHMAGAAVARVRLATAGGGPVALVLEDVGWGAGGHGGVVVVAAGGG